LLYLKLCGKTTSQSLATRKSDLKHKIMQVYPVKAALAVTMINSLYFSMNSRKLTCSLSRKGADPLQTGEIGFQMYARFPMGFIGWPNSFM
jgi:hypothetical protein